MRAAGGPAGCPEPDARAGLAVVAVRKVYGAAADVRNDQADVPGPGRSPGADAFGGIRGPSRRTGTRVGDGACEHVRDRPTCVYVRDRLPDRQPLGSRARRGERAGRWPLAIFRGRQRYRRGLKPRGSRARRMDHRARKPRAGLARRGGRAGRKQKFRVRRMDRRGRRPRGGRARAGRAGPLPPGKTGRRPRGRGRRRGFWMSRGFSLSRALGPACPMASASAAAFPGAGMAGGRGMASGRTTAAKGTAGTDRTRSDTPMPVHPGRGP
jgi:hypothetical protein